MGIELKKIQKKEEVKVMITYVDAWVIFGVGIFVGMIVQTAIDLYNVCKSKK